MYLPFAIWIGKSCSSRNGKVLGFCYLDHQCSFPLLAELEGSIRRNIFEGQDDISFAVNGAVILRWFSLKLVKYNFNFMKLRDSLSKKVR